MEKMMRLISKSAFKDYYDACIAYGIDPKVVFVRTKKEYKVSGWESENAQVLSDIGFNSAFSSVKIPAEIRYCFGGTGDRVDFAFIGFCGRIYPFLRVSEPSKLSPYHLLYTAEAKVVYLHSYDDLLKYHAENPDLGVIKRFIECKEMRRFFEPIENAQPFLNAKTPIFAFCKDTFTVCPKLSELGFAKVIDGHQAFQEISAFISGTLDVMNQVPPLPITDKERAASKGFDQMSFRKRKPAAG